MEKKWIQKKWMERKWMQKKWTVQLDGVAHEVELHWTYWGGVRKVVVDEREVDRSSKIFRWRSEQSFDLGRRRATVTTKPSRGMSPKFTIELSVDGSPVTSTSPLSRWEAPAGAW